MNKKFTALLMALLLALTLCVPAMAVSEYGVIYDETDSLGSVELDYMGEHALPELSEKLQMDLRIDVFTDENVSADTDVMDIAEYVYENSGYGWGENRDGVSLTLLMRAQPDGTYALAEDDWSIYTFLSQTRGSAQDLADTVYDAVAPYMAERAWNGEDVTMSGTALIQATDAMMNAVTEYIQRRFQCRVLRGLHIASGRSLRLFYRRGEIGDWLVILSGQKYLRLINGDLVCDPQPVQQHFSIGAGQSEPEPLIARLQFDSAVDVSFQKAQRVKALHPAKLLYGGDRLGQHDSFSGHGLILPS